MTNATITRPAESGHNRREDRMPASSKKATTASRSKSTTKSTPAKKKGGKTPAATKGKDGAAKAGGTRTNKAAGTRKGSGVGGGGPRKTAKPASKSQEKRVKAQSEESTQEPAPAAREG